MSWLRSNRLSNRTLAIINRHYLKFLVQRSELIMAALDDMKAEVARSTAATERSNTNVAKLIALIQNHPSDATVAVDDAAMADAAAALKTANDAADASNAAAEAAVAALTLASASVEPAAPPAA